MLTICDHRRTRIDAALPRKAGWSPHAKLRSVKIWLHYGLQISPVYLAEQHGTRRCTPKRMRQALGDDRGLLFAAKGIAVLHHLPIFRQFFHFHKNPSSSVLSGTFSRENCFPPKPKKRPKIAKHTKHEPLPKRDAISLKFP